MTEDERIDRCWRALMRAWAVRWRLIRRDPQARARAELCVREACKCRDKMAQKETK